MCGRVIQSSAAPRYAIVDGMNVRDSRVAQVVGDDLGGLGQIPLQMTGEPRSVVENAEQDRRHPLAARGEHLLRSMMTVPMPQAANVLGLVAADLAIGARSR